MDFINTFTVTKEAGSQTKIEGEIPFAELEKNRAAAIAKLGKNIEIDGFRKGNVPEDMLIEKIGEMALLSEMAERALAKAYPEVLTTNNIDAIGHPQIQITKIAKDNPLGFTITVATVPEITLADYKKIAVDANGDKESTTVTDADVDKQIEDVLRQKVAYERMQELAKKKAETENTKKDLGDATELPTPESEAAKADASETKEDGHVHDENCNHEDEEPEEIPASELPELTDDLVKTLGQPGQFESVEDFKTKMKEHLTIEKEREVIAAHRAKITDKITEESVFELPQILIDSEINQMFAQMNEDLTRANLQMDDYLGHIKKTKEDMIKEWTPAAEKRARLQLILNEIAKKEETKADQSQVDQQVDQLMEQYKDADEARVRVYVESVMTNEAVMQMLESQ